MIDPISFRKHLHSLGIGPDTRLLVAASGGMDSMVLCALLLEINQPFEMAHINYGLRASESDGDEAFLRTYARRRGIPFHLLLVDAKNESKQIGMGIQEVARHIRYRWFRTLAAEGGTRITTAHHRNDQAETILFRFMRGSGLKGLTGMEAGGEILRPMLDYTRAEIEDYARKKRIRWREDSSNASTNYARNRIRHKLIPEIERINPGFVDTLLKQAAIYRDASTLLEETLRGKINELSEEQGFPVKLLSEMPYKRLLLWNILEPCGFSPAQVEEAAHLLGSPTGKQIHSATHSLYRNRSWLVLEPLAELSAQRELSGPGFFQIGDRVITLEFVTSREADFTAGHDHAWLSASAVPFPLTVRPWRPGDTFHPLGMKGTVKVSDFLTQQKVSGEARKKVLVLLSEGKVCWVVGYRIDGGYRMKPQTRKVLHVFLAER